MLINKADKGHQTQSHRPFENWLGDEWYLVEDGTPLAKKVMQLYPNFDFIVEDGVLVDVVEVEAPPPPLPTAEENRSTYEALTHEFIREKYSQDDENKILREYLVDKTRSEVEFTAYNAYVLDCKTRAHSQVYGEGVT